MFCVHLAFISLEFDDHRATYITIHIRINIDYTRVIAFFHYINVPSASRVSFSGYVKTLAPLRPFLSVNPRQKSFLSDELSWWMGKAIL